MCDDVLPKLIQALPDIVNPVLTVYRHSRQSQRGGGGGRRRETERETETERQTEKESFHVLSTAESHLRTDRERERGGGGGGGGRGGTGKQRLRDRVTARKNCTTEREGGREGERERDRDRDRDRQTDRQTETKRHRLWDTERELYAWWPISWNLFILDLKKQKQKQNFHWPVMIGNIYETIQSIILRLPPTGD